jgi:hypothetical protein
MKRKTLIAILMLVIGGTLAISTVQTTSTATDEVTGPKIIELGVGEHKFWDGDYVDTTTTPELGQDSYTYRLVTQNGGSRLRVALTLVPDYRRNADGTVYEEDKDRLHPNSSSGREFPLAIFRVENGVEQPLAFTPADSDQTLSYSRELFVCFNDFNHNGKIDYPEESCNWITNGFQRTRDDYAVALAGDSGGEWIVRVTPGVVAGWSFRMRAKLEQSPTEPVNTQELAYPNLRALPPFELTFCEPLVAVGFFAGREPVCGADSDGLTEQEKADLVAHHAAEGEVNLSPRGLRFASGPENVGDGHLVLFGKPNGAVNDHGNPLANVEQRVYYRGSGKYTSSTSEPYQPNENAGTMDFHLSHGHWHYQFFRYTLFRVTDANRPLTKVKLSETGVGSKAGFCPSDEILGDWRRFYQSPRLRQAFDRCAEDRGTDNKEDLPNLGQPPIVLEPLPPPGYAEFLFTCSTLGCISPTRPQMGLSAGWGDNYEWQRVEQFVEFPVSDGGSPRDGLYLLRAEVDSEHKVDESDEDDNTSYTLFEVKGGRINILKSGYGLEP